MVKTKQRLKAASVAKVNENGDVVVRVAKRVKKMTGEELGQQEARGPLVPVRPLAQGVLRRAAPLEVGQEHVLQPQLQAALAKGNAAGGSNRFGRSDRRTRSRESDAHVPDADGAAFTKLCVVNAKTPPRSYITGVSSSTGKRVLICEVSKRQSENYQAMAQQLKAAVQSRNLTKEQALAMRAQLLEGEAC